MCERTEIEQVRAAQAGDWKALEQLTTRYRQICLAQAGQIAGRDRAEDVVQDAFFLAMKGLHSLSDPERFAPWLAAIVRNRAKRVARESCRTFPLSQLPEITLGSLTVPVMPLEGHALRIAISRLPDQLRRLVQLHYLEGYSVADLSTFLGLPSTTIKWHLHSARNQLRSILGTTTKP